MWNQTQQTEKQDKRKERKTSYIHTYALKHHEKKKKKTFEENVQQHEEYKISWCETLRSEFYCANTFMHLVNTENQDEG